MKVKFFSKYKSITEFKEVEFKNFTVLTGVNGSGKTHLLEAIKDKKVRIEGYVNSNRIVLFNYENFKLENENKFTAYQIQQDKINAWNWFNQNVRNNIKNFRKNFLKDNYENLKNKAINKNQTLFSTIYNEVNST